MDKNKSITLLLGSLGLGVIIASCFKPELIFGLAFVVLLSLTLFIIK